MIVAYRGGEMGPDARRSDETMCAHRGGGATPGAAATTAPPAVATFPCGEVGGTRVPIQLDTQYELPYW